MTSHDPSWRHYGVTYRDIFMLQALYLCQVWTMYAKARKTGKIGTQRDCARVWKSPINQLVTSSWRHSGFYVQLLSTYPQSFISIGPCLVYFKKLHFWWRHHDVTPFPQFWACIYWWTNQTQKESNIYHIAVLRYSASIKKFMMTSP